MRQVLLFFAAYFWLLNTAMSLLIRGDSKMSGRFFRRSTAASEASESSSPLREKIPNQYIVVLRQEAFMAESSLNTMVSDAIAADPTGAILHVYNILPDPMITAEDDESVEAGAARVRTAEDDEAIVFQGFAVRCSEETAASLAADARVAYVEQDEMVTIAQTAPKAVTQNNAIWNLDRISRPDRPVGNRFVFPDIAGYRTRIYIIDTGVYDGHNEIKGRVVDGVSFIQGEDWRDRHGHGSHVSGTAAGSTYGVAKRAEIVPVRVLNAQGSGSWSGIIAGVQWAVTHARDSRRRSVANMSVEGGKVQSLNDAIGAAVSAGLHFAVAAGNNNIDACQTSPGSASANGAITVGNSNINDQKSGGSNWGTCVTIFAPGESILSIGIDSPSATRVMTGTSMASPHIAGLVATYLSVANQRTRTMRDMVVRSGSSNKLSGINNSPNVLSYLQPDGCFSCTARLGLDVDTNADVTNFAMTVPENDREQVDEDLLVPVEEIVPYDPLVSNNDVAEAEADEAISLAPERTKAVIRIKSPADSTSNNEDADAEDASSSSGYWNYLRSFFGGDCRHRKSHVASAVASGNAQPNVKIHLSINVNGKQIDVEEQSD